MNKTSVLLRGNMVQILYLITKFVVLNDTPPNLYK